MAAKGKSNGVCGEEGRGECTPQDIASGRFVLPSPAEQARECQVMNLITLREVFQKRDSLTRKEARGASLVFRGVSGQLRAIEYADKQ